MSNFKKCGTKLSVELDKEGHVNIKTLLVIQTAAINPIDGSVKDEDELSKVITLLLNDEDYKNCDGASFVNKCP